MPRLDEFEDDSPADALPGGAWARRPVPVPVPRRLRPLDSCDLKEYLQTLPPPTGPSSVERLERPHIHDKLALLQRMQGREMREGPESPLSSPRKGKEVVSSVVDWLLSSGVHPAPPKASGPPASPDAMAQRRQQTKYVVVMIIIIKRISRAPIYRTRWEHRALYTYSNTNHTHTRTHVRTRARTHTHTHLSLIHI